MYLIREIKSNTFEIANFSDHKAPDAVYQVHYYKLNNHWHCNCPGFFRQKVKEDHKHILMVQEFIKRGKKPLAIDDDGYYELQLGV